MKRSIEILIVTQHSNGDEGVTRVKKVAIPDYIKNAKLDKSLYASLADQKDDMLSEYADDLAKDIKEGLEYVEREQERSMYYDW